jgi:DNA-binding transcriptional LysR family regulator
MEVFVKVVELDGLAPAARALGFVPSAISRTIARLETRLGTRLLRRSTRRLALTDEGECFYRRAVAILADMENAEREVAGAALPTGRVRINSSASYITHILRHILPDFLEKYPDIALDIIQTDSVADLIAEASDIAVRAGPLANSELIARPLGKTRIVTVAAPAWIERQNVAGAGSDRIGFTYRRAAGIWLSATNGEQERIRVSDGEGMRQLALAGIAPAQLAHFTVREDLAAGRLRILPPDDSIEDWESFYAVFLGPSHILPARIRVMLDYLGEHGRVN